MGLYYCLSHLIFVLTTLQYRPQTWYCLHLIESGSSKLIAVAMTVVRRKLKYFNRMFYCHKNLVSR